MSPPIAIEKYGGFAAKDMNGIQLYQAETMVTDVLSARDKEF